MHKPLFFAAASCAALLTLAACNSEPAVITANGPADPQQEALKNAKPVELPPSIAASRIFRCKDNSVVYVDFMSDNKIAVFRTKKGGEAVTLRAAEAGQPFEAEGHRIVGSGEEVSITAPSLGSQNCKA